MWQVRRVLFCFFRHYAQKFFAIEIAIVVTSNFITMSLFCDCLCLFLSYVWYIRPTHKIAFTMFMMNIIMFPFLIMNSTTGYPIYTSMSTDKFSVISDSVSLNSWILLCRDFLWLFFIVVVFLFVICWTCLFPFII